MRGLKSLFGKITNFLARETGGNVSYSPEIGH